ncbi:MAG: threonylcarbamoyl-AMP synthase [Lachnospiraceae bacterium]|nr:threonylcarbamoyl-AMP synthase [Lachnospiraceae bacterium]
MDIEHPQPSQITAAAEIIKAGGLVAFPTETVYGLGGNALDPKAAGKIYAAKGRPSDNPLIAHIADREELDALVAEIPPAAEVLMERYWPGPMTLVFPKTDKVPYGTTGGLDTVAVRMPSHPVARALIREAGVPIAAPSANLSGRPSPTRAEHVYEDMNGRIDMILDGGEVGIGLESTIIDVTSETPSLLRPGFISEEMLRDVLGQVEVDAASVGPIDPEAHPKAPGMKYRHYAPKADMSIIRGPQEAVVDRICVMAARALGKGKKVGIVCTEESLEIYRERLAGIGEAALLDLAVIGSRREPATIAHNLFDVLRSFDGRQVDRIYSESFEGGQLGDAIMNRLKKAAGYHIVDV